MIKEYFLHSGYNYKKLADELVMAHTLVWQAINHPWRVSYQVFRRVAAKLNYDYISAREEWRSSKELRAKQIIDKKILYKC